MSTILTTITPYWGRPEMLKTWLAAIKGARHPQVKHILCFVGECAPDWAKDDLRPGDPFLFAEFPDCVPGELSIGYYHNRGARLADTPWMMKLDIDAIPNVLYFQSLLEILSKAKPREWFNGGMVYCSQLTTANLLSADKMPLSTKTYDAIMCRRLEYCGNACTGPAATNFICRTAEYLKLGGCDDAFRGYGWEDYQQIYMLERHQLGANPLPGIVNFENVTKRCCREISRRKARELWHRNGRLCLLHRFHHASPDTRYKSHQQMLRNKQVLLDYIRANP